MDSTEARMKKDNAKLLMMQEAIHFLMYARMYKMDPEDAVKELQTALDEVVTSYNADFPAGPLQGPGDLGSTIYKFWETVAKDENEADNGC